MATLLIPPLAVALSGSASADALWTALRLAALLAFTLIFLSIASGAFRPWANRAFKPRVVQGFHQASGLTGLGLAATHGLMVLVFGLTGYTPAALWVGPAALLLLATAIVGALRRRSLRRSWRWIHRLNYLVFAAILVHGLSLGFDLRSQLLLRVIFSIYAAVVVAGLVYRLAPPRQSSSVRR